jgi:hypothetical protein
MNNHCYSLYTKQQFKDNDSQYMHLAGYLHYDDVISHIDGKRMWGNKDGNPLA